MKDYSKNIRRILSKFNLGNVSAVVFLIISFSFIYVYTTNKIQSLLISQVHQKAELSISSGASSIKIFLGMTKNSLILLSKNPSIVNQGTETQKTLDEFSLDWAETPVIGAARIDKNRVPRFVSNNISESIDLANNPIVNNKDFIAWTKTAAEGDVYLGKPLILGVESPRPQYVFPFITPIYKNGEYDGVLALAISLPKLTATYLDPLNVTPSSRVYLLHSDGTILAGPPEYIELVGVNYFEYLRNTPYPGSEEALQELTKAVEERNKGRLDLILYSTIEKKPVRFIMAHSPVAYNNEHWTLGLAVPVSDVTDANPDFLKESKIIVLSLFVYLVMTLSFVSILIVKTKYGKTSSDGLEEGKKTLK